MNYIFSTLYRVYVLELSNKKWFIYTTKETDKNNIILNSKLLYQFVSNNLPIISHNSTQLNDVLEVNFFVKKYMRLYGINNVRGGSYSDEVLSSEIKYMLEKEINTTFHDFDQIIDNSTEEYKNILDWSYETIKKTKEETLKQKELFTIENKRYDTLQKPFYNTDQKITRKLIDDYNWLTEIIDELMNEYVRCNSYNQNINDDIQEYEVADNIQNRYVSVKEMLYGLNMRFNETFEGENYLYSSYDEISNYINLIDPFFLINDKSIEFEQIIENKYNVLRQAEYMIYSLLTLLDEYKFDVNSYSDNFTFITNWKLEQIENSINVKLNDDYNTCVK
tara:strand:- start:6792 stop:7796 length:1005 start_codon:yes stop_codon:yes gene_type:complete